MRGLILLLLGLLLPLGSSRGLCDLVSIINTWGCTGPACEWDFTGDGIVSLNDIVYVVNFWTGVSDCDAPNPSQFTWTVTSSPSSIELCNDDRTISTEVKFVGVGEIEGFILQIDAPTGGAEIVENSLTFAAQGPTNNWQLSNCRIFNSQAYSYFSCENGGKLKSGDSFQISYALHNLNTRIGVFASEVTTFPPVQLSASVAVDMTCGQELPSTTAIPPTPPPEVFDWDTSITGDTQVCGTTPSSYTVSVNVKSGSGLFLMGSSFIRNEGLVFSLPQSNIPGITCRRYSDVSWACDGLADRDFDITFTLTRTGTPASGDAQISVLTGLFTSNVLDRFTLFDIRYDAVCTK